MSGLSSFTDWFTDENRETGVCLWVALDMFLPYASGGLSNNVKSRDFDKDAPQKIDMDWDDWKNHERVDPLLPCNWYSHGITVAIDPQKHPLEHEVIYKRTECSERNDLITVTSYRLPTVRHMKRLAEFLTDGRTDVLTLLEEVDVEEYILSRAQKHCGMPETSFKWPELPDEDEESSS